jgi:hypothetical protein
MYYCCQAQRTVIVEKSEQRHRTLTVTPQVAFMAAMIASRGLPKARRHASCQSTDMALRLSDVRWHTLFKSTPHHSTASLLHCFIPPLLQRLRCPVLFLQIQLKLRGAFAFLVILFATETGY